jgi:hypothetical protein
MLLDFLYNYSVVFDSDSDTNNTVYSSGGGTNYDPIRDTYGPTNTGGRNTNPTTYDFFTVPDGTDTKNLADFLEPSVHNRINSTGIRFRNTDRLMGDLKYYSKVAYCIKNENPHLFKSSPGSTTISNSFLDYIRGLNKNYDLTNVV